MIKEDYSELLYNITKDMSEEHKQIVLAVFCSLAPVIIANKNNTCNTFSNYVNIQNMRFGGWKV